MKRIYSVLVENRPSVLSRVSGLFARRNFNIDSLVVGETDDPEVSCMTIVSSGDKRTIEQIEKQLNICHLPHLLGDSPLISENLPHKLAPSGL